jgi:hypothetical protein
LQHFVGKERDCNTDPNIGIPSLRHKKTKLTRDLRAANYDGTEGGNNFTSQA